MPPLANRQRFQIFHPTLSLSQKKFLLKIFDYVIACDLWFGPPQIKNSGYVYELEIARKTFLKTFIYFFGEHLRLCPWSRAFLSLASRGSVLEKAVLGLGLEPYVLDSTSVRTIGNPAFCNFVASQKAYCSLLISSGSLGLQV